MACATVCASGVSAGSARPLPRSTPRADARSRFGHTSPAWTHRQVLRRARSRAALPTRHARVQAAASGDASPAEPAQELPPTPPGPQKSLTYTAYEGNSWGVRFDRAGVSMLVDPWLVGDLTFADLDWLYKGVKQTKLTGSVSEVTSGIDFLLISQGLDDHAHRPTLKQLDKNLPVVCSPTAAAVCRELNFKTVISLQAGESCEMCDGKISITAAAGALVGPPWSTREAAFVVREMAPDGVSLYYEPHCDYDFFNIRRIGTVDVVVSPAVSVDIAGFPLVKGYDGIAELARILRPSVIVPLLNADIEQEGPLAQAVTSRGTVEELPRLLESKGVRGVKVAVPKPLVPMQVGI